jgi:hypothetical protein
MDKYKETLNYACNVDSRVHMGVGMLPYKQGKWCGWQADKFTDDVAVNTRHFHKYWQHTSIF